MGYHYDAKSFIVMTTLELLTPLCEQSPGRRICHYINCSKVLLPVNKLISRVKNKPMI